MIRIYTASKLSSAEVWHDIQKTWPEVFCHARWLKHTQLGTPDTAEYARRFWIEDEEDVRHADLLVLYGKPNEHLRGALVEAGIALALKIPVAVIGEHPDYGTWQHHPGVVKFADFGDLKKRLSEGWLRGG